MRNVLFTVALKEVSVLYPLEGAFDKDVNY